MAVDITGLRMRLRAAAPHTTKAPTWVRAQAGIHDQIVTLPSSGQVPAAAVPPVSWRKAVFQ